MFADRVSTLGGASPSVSVISALPRKPASSKRGYLNSMLIGLMGIVFGLGIMYLLSRLMQLSRRQQQLERQLKDTSVNVNELALQVHVLASAPPPPSPQPQRPIDVPPPPKAPPMQRQVQVPMQVPTFMDFPLPLLFDDGDALVDFFVKPADLSQPASAKVEEIDEVEERKETNVKSIVQQTMEPIAQVVDELKKQSEKTTASSDSDSESDSSESAKEEQKKAPARRSTRTAAASRRKK